MKNAAIQQKLTRLQQAINHVGYNYEITLGWEEYSPCIAREDFLEKLKASYPATDTNQLDLLPSTEKESWHTIDRTLLSAGDLRPGSMEKIRPLVLEFKQAISSVIPSFAEFYHSDLPEGVPGYPVWWDFCFVIDTKSGSFLFLYGSASD